jgi:hypothetical protein
MHRVHPVDQWFSKKLRAPAIAVALHFTALPALQAGIPNEIGTIKKLVDLLDSEAAIRAA